MNRPPSRPWRRRSSLAAAGLLLGLLAVPAAGQTREFSIPAGDLKAALDAWIQQAGSRTQILYRVEDVRGQQTRGVRGQASPEAALAELLAGTALAHRLDASGAVLLVRVPAPEPPADPPPPAETVVVQGHRIAHLAERNRTGTRTETDPMALAQSVTTVSRGLVEESQARTLEEALRTVAGVRVSQDTISGIRIRGMDAALMINGSLGDPTTTRVAPPTFAIDSIEVVRGPEAVIGGQQGGYGGVVNVITKLAGGRASREVAGRLSGQAGRMLGLDLGGPLAAGSPFSARWLSSSERGGSTAAGLRGARRDYVAPSLAWDLAASGTSATLELVHDEGYKPLDVQALAPATPVPEDAGEHFRESRASLTLAHKLMPGWTLRWKGHHDALRVSSRSVASGVSASRGLPYLDIEVSDFRATVRTFDQRLELLGSPRTEGKFSHLLLAGYDGTHTRYDPGRSRWISATELNLDTGQLRDVTAERGWPQTTHYPAASRREEGLLVQDQWRWGDRWSGLAGYRWVRGQQAAEGEPAQGFHHGLPTLGVSLQPDDGLSLYASRTEGFRSNAGKLDQAGARLPDESGRQVELGVKVLPGDRRTAWTAAVYRIQQRRVAQEDLSQFPSSFFVSLPGVTSQGGEVEASGRWSGASSWRLQAAYTDARTTADRAPLPDQPRWVLGAYGRFNLSGSERAGAWVALDARWAQAVRSNVPRGSGGDPGRSELTFNLGAGFEGDGFSVMGSVKNLFDHPASVAGERSDVRPRSLSLTLRSTF